MNSLRQVATPVVKELVPDSQAAKPLDETEQTT